MAKQHELAALKVWLEASEAVRAERIARREGAVRAEVLERTRVREASDAKRYRDIYGFDYWDRSIYDIVITTDDKTPEEAAALIVARCEGAGGRRSTD
jgi:cytidylate kinase